MIANSLGFLTDLVNADLRRLVIATLNFHIIVAVLFFIFDRATFPIDLSLEGSQVDELPLVSDFRCNHLSNDIAHDWSKTW